MEESTEYDKDAILRRIRALMAKTTTAGASEQEALLAAAKVTELLNKYQLSLDEVSLKQGECIKDFMDTEVKAEQPVEWCVSTIGYLCDLKVWKNSGAGKYGGTLHYFFGYESDVIVGKYLYALIARAMVYSWQDHTKVIDAEAAARFDGDEWKVRQKSTKAKKSFLLGMADRINKRLMEMKDAQRRHNQSTGRDLIPIKSTRVQEEWDKLGLRLSKTRSRQFDVDGASYRRGTAAGDRVALNPGVKGKTDPAGYLT